MPILNMVYYGGGGGGSGLPSEYQEVEYVQSAGKCIVEVGGFTVSSYERLEYKFNPVNFYTESGGIPFFFGNVPDGQNYLTTNSSKTKFQVGVGNSDIETQSISTGTDYTIVQTMSSGTLTMVTNGSSMTSSYSGSLNAAHFPLFCRYRSSSAGYNYGAYNMKLYYFKIYNSANNCVRDLVPCYRKADTVVGLYDLISNTFYTNTGSGTLNKGGDVN